MNSTYPLYKHQAEAISFSKGSSYFALFMEQGTGKSKVIIETMKWLWAKQAINAVLIVAPKGVYLNWLNDELPKHLDLPMTEYTVHHWAAGFGKKAKGRLEDLAIIPDHRLKVLCMNVEAFSSPTGCEYAQDFLTHNRTLFVIDESTSIKNHKALRTKAIRKLGGLAPYRRILTGTPQTRNPLDLFSQCEFLKSGLLGHTSFMSYRNCYAEVINMRLGPRSYPKIVGFRNLNRLSAMLGKFSYRKLKSECLDLPPKIYMKRYVEPTAEQKAAYKEMTNESILDFGQDGAATAAIALTRIMRLHQIMCGHITLDNSKQAQEIPSNRVNVLMDILEETEGKVIIWCNFRKDVELVTRALTAEYGKESFVEYHGGISLEDREKSKITFRTNSTCKYFIATLGTGSRGLTLVEAKTMIYYSQNHDLEKRLQSEDRAHRIGQTETLTLIDLVAAGTVDEDIVRSHQNKLDLATLVIDRWRIAQPEQVAA